MQLRKTLYLTTFFFILQANQPAIWGNFLNFSFKKKSESKSKKVEKKEAASSTTSKKEQGKISPSSWLSLQSIGALLGTGSLLMLWRKRGPAMGYEDYPKVFPKAVIHLEVRNPYLLVQTKERGENLHILKIKEKKEEIQRKKLPTRAQVLDFSSAEKYWVLLSRGAATLWQLSKEEYVGTIPHRLPSAWHRVTYCPGNHLIALGNRWGYVHFWHMEEEKKAQKKDSTLKNRLLQKWEKIFPSSLTLGDCRLTYQGYLYVGKISLMGFSPKGVLLTVHERSIRLFERFKRKKKIYYRETFHWTSQRDNLALALSQEREEALLATKTGRIFLYPTSTKKENWIDDRPFSEIQEEITPRALTYLSANFFALSKGAAGKLPPVIQIFCIARKEKLSPTIHLISMIHDRPTITAFAFDEASYILHCCSEKGQFLREKLLKSKLERSHRKIMEKKFPTPSCDQEKDGGIAQKKREEKEEGNKEEKEEEMMDGV